MASNSKLPQEIIADILTRLPAKSIGRFRCVSKPWRALLTHPHFIKTHLNRLRNLQQESLLLLSESSHCFYAMTLNNAHHLLDEMPLDPKRLSFAGYPDNWTEILASCDGLVLVCDRDDKKFLINPTTREVKEVPVSPFALNPCASFTMHGIGYDSVNDDYKIVTLSYYDTDNEDEPDCTEMFVDVYSVRKGTWKKVESSPYDHTVGHVSSGVFLDGYIHWLACRTTDYSSVITAFNLAEEKFCEIPPPGLLDSKKFVFHHLVVLGGCLSMYNLGYKNETDVWVMEEYGVQKSWTRYLISDVEGSEYKPICLVGQEQLMLVKDEETVDEKLVKYNLKEGSFKDIVVHGILDYFHAGGTFMECLITPHCTDETGRGH